jgi:hypothetical protein
MDFEDFKKFIRFDEKYQTATEAAFTASVVFGVQQIMGNIDSIDDVRDSMHERLAHALYHEMQKQFGYTSDALLAVYHMGQIDGARGVTYLDSEEVLRQAEKLKGQA